MTKFEAKSFYSSDSSYKLLPFKFHTLENSQVLLVNVAGDHIIVDRSSLTDLLEKKLSQDTRLFKDLRSKHFLYDKHTHSSPTLLALKLKTRYRHLQTFTQLHMFVVSLRCEHSCPYCQVSRQSDDKIAYDMSEEVALKSIELALQSPSRDIKIEFQGGEPLLNFPMIKFIVAEAKKQNTQKNLSFVIATNLAVLTDEILDFCKRHDIAISTSLDGPQEIHNKNRPRPGNNSYEKTISGIHRVREKLGIQKISALMTTTYDSLPNVKAIIDTYVRLEFPGIFLRPLSPYGFAIKTKRYEKYGLNEWLNFYFEGLDYIVELNRNGVKFREFYTSVLAKKILSLDDPGYIDLRSPAGLGIAGVIYNYDGKVFASDEGRMLFEMGDDCFHIGNVLSDTYEDIFLNENLIEALEDSFTLSVPMCSDCALEPFCGSDPTFHYATQGDYIGKKPLSEFCSRHMKIIPALIMRMEKDEFFRNLCYEWAKQ